MTAKTAKSAASPRTVLFVVYPDIVLLDLVGPLQVFSHAQDPATGTNGYACAVASATGEMTPTNTVVPIPTQPLSEFRETHVHTLVVVGGDGALVAMHDGPLLDQIRALAGRAQRVASVCSGALVLAAAGLLDGRRAVTHWEDCAMLADQFPQVRVDMDPIYVRDGPVWTSAGITAGMDMALAIVREDLGRGAAFDMARSMVTHMVRSGGQSQFSPVLHRQLRDRSGRFDALHAAIAADLSADLSVEALAARTGMSPRNFARIYARTMGVTPAKAVEAIRTEAAQALLEDTDLSLKTIAARTGFGEEDRMRRAFLRLLNVSPSAYRQSFQVG